MAVTDKLAFRYARMHACLVAGSAQKSKSCALVGALRCVSSWEDAERARTAPYLGSHLWSVATMIGGKTSCPRRA